MMLNIFYVLTWFGVIISLVTDAIGANPESLYSTINDQYGDYDAIAYRSPDTNKKNASNTEWPFLPNNRDHEGLIDRNMEDNGDYNPLLKSKLDEPMANTGIGAATAKSDRNALEFPEIQDISKSVFPPVSMSLKQNLGACVKRTLPCNIIPGFVQTCQAHCAVQSIPAASSLAPVISSLGNVLETTLKAMCKPFQTAFEFGWHYFVESDRAVYSFAAWQRRMGIDVKYLAYDQIRMLADYVFGQVIRFADTPLRVLRGAYEEVDIALEAVQAGAELYKSYNPGCFGLAFQKSANKFVDIFYRHPNMLDVFLSGSLFVVNTGKHIPGDHQDLFESVSIVSEAILGTSCGVLYWAGVRDAFCDQKAGIDSHAKLDINEPYCPVTEVEVYVTLDD